MLKNTFNENKLKIFIGLFPFLPMQIHASCDDWIRDLELVAEIDREVGDKLPFFYNYSMVGGYFNMPSARLPEVGQLAAGAATVPPYYVFGANFALYSRLELSANYRVFRGVLEKNFGHEGFGDDADRIANVKIGVLCQEDGLDELPELAIGFDDFIGTKRFHSAYIVATKQWKEANLECSIGWGKGRLRGPFGAIAWSPLRFSEHVLLKGWSLLAEYDAINYKKHAPEHAKGRSVDCRINAGLSYSIGDAFQFSASTLRGKRWAGSISAHFPLGTTEGLFAKTRDPKLIWEQCHLDQDLCEALLRAFSDQGLDLYNISLKSGPCRGKQLWLKIVNNRYRQECALRERLECLLASAILSDIESVSITVEAEGVASHSYFFRTADLCAFHCGKMGKSELEILSPMCEARIWPETYEASHLLERKRKAWTFTFHPRLLTFFGSASGKFKYSVGAVAAAEGYLPGQLIYRIQGAYDIYSSMHGLSGSDRLNPSHLLQVRSDSMRYFRARRADLEQAYMQRSWNLGKGCFYRLAGGYFEPAYGGTATEFLWYPVRSNWAFGFEGAVVWKRHYGALSFFHRIPKFTKHHVEEKKHFVGLQGFFHLYYDFEPLSLDFDIAVGQFLARDKGVRIQATRRFQNGLRFSLWATFTNGHDRVNNHRYFDKGFAFEIPFDFFLRQSSRTFLGYAMSAWLRDVGATADTGQRLYPTLREERTN